MKNAEIDTALFDRAAVFAVRAHAGTERRGKGFPYVIHPMEAASIVATMTSDQELLAAAVLHDVVEDTSVTVDEIRDAFGGRVAALVAAESDRVIPEMIEHESWFVRKQEAIDRLGVAPLDVKMVALGDKLSNMRAIARDYAVLGDRLWDLFRIKDRESHAWHYRGLADSLVELSETAAYQEFKRLVEQVFGTE
ncbi:MAG: bifunctional (p)ppGpp synthetase/guanosine-3',5'-bis(diphosphate) 3'-pyrophosphohydrolase [Bacteroidales bacterium]|nr:bifunctional (p)ppGpp synthetase/guanosine-3',5'-bis(diphosphate) 3'-pyrophosphohydrolase [Bacteroidales bacterium]